MLADKLAQHGWCVIPDFISTAKVNQLRSEILTSWLRGSLRPAGIGWGTYYQTNNNIRNDYIKWLECDISASQQYYLAQMEQLRMVINRELYLGLSSFECHQTVYPPGTYYRKHLDQFRNNNTRALTTILYLNPEWQEQDGGELVLYHNLQDEQGYEIIRPAGGQLVCFLSDRFPHEVRTTYRERVSITGWFCRCKFHG